MVLRGSSRPPADFQALEFASINRLRAQERWTFSAGSGSLVNFGVLLLGGLNVDYYWVRVRCKIPETNERRVEMLTADY